MQSNSVVACSWSVAGKLNAGVALERSVLRGGAGAVDRIVRCVGVSAVAALGRPTARAGSARVRARPRRGLRAIVLPAGDRRHCGFGGERHACLFRPPPEVLTARCAPQRECVHVVAQSV